MEPSTTEGSSRAHRCSSDLNATADSARMLYGRQTFPALYRRKMAMIYKLKLTQKASQSTIGKQW